MKEIVVGGGCFWGVQEYYRRLKGIIKTEVGYAQGNVAFPKYEQVKSQLTNHREVCRIFFDESIIDLYKVLEHLFRIIDPTLINQQGMDIGTQYQCGIYYINNEDLSTINDFIKTQSANYPKEITCEVQKLKEFFSAEDYHQNYLVKNPDGYCHVDFSKIEKDELK